MGANAPPGTPLPAPKYSATQNRSRIDFFGGSTKRYYYKPVLDEKEDEITAGHIYMFHPESNAEEEAVMICEKMHNDFGDIVDFLPDISDFEYSGTDKYGNLEILVYKNNAISPEMRQEETLYVIDKDGTGIPIQHVKQVYGLESGGQTAHTIINYYNYDETVNAEELEADEEACKSWAYGFEESVDRLHPEIPSDVNYLFHSFKKHHKKEYEEKEHEYRKAVFLRNWKRVEEHNKKNLGYKLAINRFSDKTMDELRYLAATKYSEPIRGTEPFPHTVEEVDRMAEKLELPESYDLRDEGVISPVRNQASCGSCWAFAAAATMEAAVARNNGGRVFDLSEQSLVDCAWQYQSHGCGGTEAIGAVFKYLVDYGIPTVEEYGPYLMEDGLCHVNNMTNTYQAKGFVAVTPNSPNALKAAIYKYGPVTIGVDATSSMVAYKSGIFYDFESTPGSMNHAVTLVGYGSHYGEPYWIVKNSWGQDWGEDGYIRIAAKDNNCNVMTSPVYPLVG